MAPSGAGPGEAEVPRSLGAPTTPTLASQPVAWASGGASRLSNAPTLPAGPGPARATFRLLPSVGSWIRPAPPRAEGLAAGMGPAGLTAPAGAGPGEAAAPTSPGALTTSTPASKP
eukprot:15153609-Alexandrium_andersonii.AAC.1